MANVDDTARVVEGVGDIGKSTFSKHRVELIENIQFSWRLDNGDWVGM